MTERNDLRGWALKG